MGKVLRIHNRDRATVIVRRGRVANTLRARLVGLIGRRHLPQGFGLLLPSERAIHTIGMRIPIDVVYLDRQSRVIQISQEMQPGKIVTVQNLGMSDHPPEG